MKRQIALISAVLLVALGVRAFGDYTATTGAGTTVFAFVCSAKICPGSVPMTSAGVEIVPSTAANQTSELTKLDSIITNTGAAIPAGTANIGNVGQISQYPTGATAITASATGTTGATTATLAGTGGKTTFLCSLSIRSNATAAATGNATVTGTITGTLNFTHWTAPNASGIGLTEMIFNPCVPASAVNTGIAIVSPAPGTGGVVSSTGTGYQL